MFNQNLFAKKLTGLTPYKVDTASYDIRLDANESYISLPDSIRKQMQQSIENFNFNRYPDPDASLLVDAFCDFYGVKGENVCAGNGSDEIISLLMNCFLDYNDAVMTFSPDFSMYAFYASLAGAKVVDCPKDDNFQIDFTLAENLIKKNNVKLCIFSNPCNPTGKIESKENIKELANRCPDTIFVSDEAYMDFSNRDESFLQETVKYPNIVVLKTLSKALGCAAMRLGFIVSDKSFTDMFKAVKSPYNVNGISQEFGRLVLTRKDALRSFTQDIISSTSTLLTLLEQASNTEIPQTFTNFAFIPAKNAQRLWNYLKQNGILVRYFNISGGSLRITAGNNSENIALCEKIKNFGGFEI